MLEIFSYNPTKKYKETIKKINELYYSLRHYSNDNLKKQTEKLSTKLKNNQLELEEILVEAFATIKEAIARATGIVLFDVQLLGGIILHLGKIAEMKTGEGKTFVALLPAYLNSLKLEGVHIVTVNDYLAERDAELAQKILGYLDINVGKITQNTSDEDRKQAYNMHITYITNSELGFDYLKDNMAIDKKNIVQRQLNYVIIDEVDSILIDEARTPLIISGEIDAVNTMYNSAMKVSSFMEKTKDYEVDEKSRNIILTEQGISFCENELGITNLYDINSPWLKYIINALKAKELFLRDKDYIVKNDKIIIVDEFTGRIMEGRRWSDGLHQSIEAKEKVQIEKENRILASITYQNLFLLYSKLCGMTGTAKTEENEFINIYKTYVVEIPTNKKCARKDLPDLVYQSEYSKWEAITKECFDMYQIGRPILVGTTSIEKSELLANMLKQLKIPYQLLNAKPENNQKEADIIAKAGRLKNITISTNMAGRGTDIILGGNPRNIIRDKLTKYLATYGSNPELKKDNIMENTLNPDMLKILKKFIETRREKKWNDERIVEEIIHQTKDKGIALVYSKLIDIYTKLCESERQEVINLGGLHVIGTERHESRRIDNQLRGRSGRQGDKGTSRFFLSLQDSLFRIFGGNSIKRLMKNMQIEEEIPIESVILSKSLDNAQKKVESYFYDIRKQLFEYDDVINNQRKAIYTERKRILYTSFNRDCIIEYGEYTIEDMLKRYGKNIRNTETIKEIEKLLNIKWTMSKRLIDQMEIQEIRYFLYEQLRISYDLKESYLEQLRPGLTRQLERYYLLQQIDKAWQDHIDKMNLLKEYIGWRSYGQQDPLIEYKNEGFHLFINMITYIRQTVIYLLMRSRLIIDSVE